MPTVAVSIQRSAKAGEPATFERHEVEVSERASILDALFALQRGPVPDLAFRFSCRVGMCGSCAMVVNGKERLTCSTLIKTVGYDLKIQPLRNLPVVRDLAVDLKPFFSAYQRTMRLFRPALRPRQKRFLQNPAREQRRQSAQQPTTMHRLRRLLFKLHPGDTQPALCRPHGSQSRLESSHRPT